MNKRIGCDVLDEKGNFIIQNGDFIYDLSKQPNGEITHVRVGYWPDTFSGEDEYTSKIFPIKQIYFRKREIWELGR
jgi:hypothetical protein